MATPNLLAHVIVAKYCDHLPLYRQAQVFARHGVEIKPCVGIFAALCDPGFHLREIPDDAAGCKIEATGIPGTQYLIRPPACYGFGFRA